MKLGFKGFFKRGQKGFTLVELMVVMAIMAVLSAIVVPAVSGTSEVSKDSAVRQDASTVATAVSDFYAAKEGAEKVTITPCTILEATLVNQTTSDSWPELALTDNTTVAGLGYSVEFPAVKGAATGNVTAVVISETLSDGSPKTIPADELAKDYTTIRFRFTGGSGGLTNIDPPKSVISASGNYHDYLWLLKRTTVTSDGKTVTSRQVTVFKLSKVEEASDDGDTLYYVKIY